MLQSFVLATTVGKPHILRAIVPVMTTPMEDDLEVLQTDHATTVGKQVIWPAIVVHQQVRYMTERIYSKSTDSV